MKKRVAAVLLLLSFTLPAQAAEECPEGFIHYSVLCITPYEYAELTNPPTPLPLEEPILAFKGVEQWRHIVEYFWPDWAIERMIRIMHCESRGDPSAKNPRSSATGLFQIMGSWQKKWPGDYTDPWTNAAVAYQIWLEADRYGDPFSPWVCRG
jgi:hypothetical protein